MAENFLKEQSEKLGISVEELRTVLDSEHPIGHIGEPNDIAYDVLYLVSDEAKFVSESELVIDGGYTAWWPFINAGEIMKYISISLDDEDFEHLSMAKGDRTWQEYIMKDVLNQRRRKELQVLVNK